MLKVRLHHSEKGILKGFKISGHAVSAAKGENILCASVTLLAFACAEKMKKIIADDRLHFLASKGSLEVYVRKPLVRQNELELVDTVLDVLVAGVKLLMKNEDFSNEIEYTDN